MKTEERHFDYLCECGGRACRERISLSSSEANKIFNQDGIWAIADSCLHGPESNYVMVEEGGGYKTYQVCEPATATLDPAILAQFSDEQIRLEAYHRGYTVDGPEP